MAKSIVCVCLLLLSMLTPALCEGGVPSTVTFALRAASSTTVDSEVETSGPASKFKAVIKEISTVDDWSTSFPGLGSMSSDSASEEKASTSRSSSKSSSRSSSSFESTSTSSNLPQSSSDEEKTTASRRDESSTSTSRPSSSTSDSDTSDESSTTSSSPSSTDPARITSESPTTFNTITSMPPSPTSVPTLSAPPTTSLDLTASPSASATPTPAPVTESSSNLGTVLGASIGGLAGLLILGFFISWFIRYRKDKRRHAAQSPDGYIPGPWPDNRPYDPNRNTSMENTNTNNYTRPAARTRPLSQIGAGRFYAPSISAVNTPLPRTPTIPATGEVGAMTQIHEAPTRSTSAPAAGDTMEMRSNPAMPNNASSSNMQRGTSVQDQQSAGHQYRGVQMTGAQVPDSLRPGHRGPSTSPWVTASELYAQQHGGQQWRTPAW